MECIVRVSVWGAVGLACFYTLLATTVGVSFYRLVPLDNDPLSNSIAITSISGTRFTLADGKVLLMPFEDPERLRHDMLDSGGRLELDASNPHFPTVYVKKKKFVCGTHGPRVVIPLVRSEYAGFYRHRLGMGEFE